MTTDNVCNVLRIRRSAPNRWISSLDTEELHALADGALIGKALRHAHNNRVTRVAFVDGELVATVEDADREEQLDLRLGYNADGNLWTIPAFVYGLAALLAYGTAGDLDGQFNWSRDLSLHGRQNLGPGPADPG